MSPQEQVTQAALDRHDPAIQAIPTHQLMESLEPIRAEAELWRRIMKIAPQELFPDGVHMESRERAEVIPEQSTLLKLSGLLEIYENGLLDLDVGNE